ncbi:MAG: sulfite exporter TauE/SafE family protein [bacterium]|jgi:uncharacterized membrane protein YfcA
MAELELATLLVLAVAAFVGAAISGLLGMGGGLFLLSVLFLCGLEPSVAIPVHALVQLSSNTSRAVLFRASVRWSAWRVFALCALPFPLLGLVIAGCLDGASTKILIGALVLFATWKPTWWRMAWRERAAFCAMGVVAGTLGVVVGATGPLIAPFFLRDGWRKEEIIATKAACQVFVHLQKIVVFGVLGFAFGEELIFVLPLVIAVIFGTALGKRALAHVSEERFRLAYRVLLTALALRLVATPWL